MNHSNRTAAEIVRPALPRLAHARGALMCALVLALSACGADSEITSESDAATLDCSDLVCGAGTCDDSSGAPVCTCDPRFATGASGVCDTCAPGYAGDECDACADGYVDNLVVPGSCVVGLAIQNGLALWLDAEVTESFTIVGEDAVMVWADRVGGGHDLSMLSDNSRPTYEDDAINGKPAVKFDGVDDHLVTTTFDDLEEAGGYAVFIVGYSVEDDRGCFLGGVDANDDYGLWIRSQSSNQLEFGHDGNFAEPGGNDIQTTTGGRVSRTAAQVLSFIRRPAPLLTHAIRVGGVQETYVAPQGVAFADGFNSLSMGVCPGAASSQLAGYVGEVLIYSRTLQPDEVQEIEAYLRAKWEL